MTEDLYKILGIPPDADEKEVRSAYRSLAKKYHPDKGHGSSDERFRAVQHAYDVLGDEQQRAAYDRDRQRIPARSAETPQWLSRNAPFSQHIDLRYLSRRGPAPKLEFVRRPGFVQVEDDPWDDLIALLFGEY